MVKNEELPAWLKRLRPLCHMLHIVSIKLSEVVRNLLFLLLVLTQAVYVIMHSTTTQRRQSLLLSMRIFHLFQSIEINVCFSLDDFVNPAEHKWIGRVKLILMKLLKLSLP